MNKVRKIILFIESSRKYGRDIVHGIAQYSLLHGPWTFYKEDTFYSRFQRLSKDFSWIKRWGADGIITRDFKELHKLIDLNLPIIAVEAFQEDLSDVTEIVSDHEAMGKLACDYFKRRGFKNFAFCGFRDLPWSIHRNLNFERILRENGSTLSSFNSDSSRLLQWDKEYPRLIEWLKSLPKPVAILCCNDDRGFDVLEACKTAGLNVPYEVAVLGIDNDEQVCKLANPPLSSITLTTKKAGYMAAKYLDLLMSKKEVDVSKIEVKPMGVCTRSSTDSMAIDDEQVVQAMEYINLNHKKIIQVSDVLQEIGCSRTALDSKFMKFIGHSVFQEIRRIRTKKICELLLQTNLPVYKIALQLGYSDADHIARFFKQEKNMTPLEYRQKHSV